MMAVKGRGSHGGNREKPTLGARGMSSFLRVAEYGLVWRVVGVGAV